ncbi:MAG: CAP domain-containing protein, partial [Planctomycetes bacterium]|nr:CAP domain-containing protein [Planctomycetota bacterium]
RAALTATLACCTTILIASGCSFDWDVLAMPPTGTRQPTAAPNNPPRRTPPRTAKPCFKLGPPKGPEQREFFRLVNDYRSRKGLRQLRYSRSLELAANRFAKQMYREDFFSHNAPDGSVPGDRVVAAGYCDPIVGENIAYGLNRMDTAGETMQSLIDSPHHNENMLLKRWRYAGMGFFKIDGPKGTEYWWVQLFGMDVPDNAILPKVKPLGRSQDKDRKARKGKKHRKQRGRTDSKSRRGRRSRQR